MHLVSSIKTLQDNAKVAPKLTPITAHKTMSPRHIQCANEYTFCRKYIDRYLRYEITNNADLQQKIIATTADIFTWLREKVPATYPSKIKRLQPLQDYSDEKMLELVTRMTIGCAYCQTPELFTSITAQLANRLNWENKRDAIITISELLVHLAINDVINITQQATQGMGAKYKRQSLVITANIPLSAALVRYVDHSSYLPPLVCKPKPVTNNRQSGYHTFNDSVVLNHRIEESLALDVINTQNSIPLTIDLEFVLNVEDIPNKPLDTVEKISAWAKFKKDTHDMLLLIFGQAQGNRELPGAIYFHHKFDKRGRMYCQGYHINYQGNAYRKAMIEFHDLEFIDVPEQYQVSNEQ